MIRTFFHDADMFPDVTINKPMGIHVQALESRSESWIRGEVLSQIPPLGWNPEQRIDFDSAGMDLDAPALLLLLLVPLLLLPLLLPLPPPAAAPWWGSPARWAASRRAQTPRCDRKPNAFLTRWHIHGQICPRVGNAWANLTVDMPTRQERVRNVLERVCRVYTHMTTSNQICP